MIKMPKKSLINIVIEGGFQNSWRDKHYKISGLAIPEGVTKINDGEYNFTLSGKTDFVNIEEVKYNGNKEITIESLASCKGISLEYNNYPPNNWLQRPRSIITRDGRIFIDHSFDIEYHVEYGTNIIPSMVALSKDFFNNKEWDEFYKKYSSVKKISIPKKKLKSSSGVIKLNDMPEISEYYQMRKKLMGE